MNDHHQPGDPPARPVTAGYAALADKLLDTAYEYQYDQYGKKQTVRPELAALQGIGYALLAVDERLADLTDATAGNTAHLEQLAVTAAGLASRARRPWSRARRRAAAQTARAAEATRPAGTCRDAGIPADSARCSVTLTADDAALARQALIDAAVLRRSCADGTPISWNRCDCGSGDGMCQSRAQDADTARAYLELHTRLMPAGAPCDGGEDW